LSPRLRAPLSSLSLFLLVASGPLHAAPADGPAAPASQPAAAPAARPAAFGVRVVDDRTGRGVPLVELRTVSGVRFVTDSAGYAAVDDPALFGRRVFFNVSSHGYEYAADGFGMRGKALELTPGGSADLKIKRLNIAERLYRVTGEGIYRDSVLLGRTPPIAEPLLNAEVVGQDSVQVAAYRGKLYWFWGDTSRQRYPLGHFGTAGATSDLPSGGGLPPDVGTNFTYFTDKDGFSRPTVAREGASPLWLDGLFVVKDSGGKEHLLGCVAVIKTLGHTTGRRLVEWDDDKAMFRTLRELPVDGPARPHGHAVVAGPDGKPYAVDGKPYVLFADPVPTTRVPATYEAAIDPANYETFTCLPSGAFGPAEKAKIERSPDGRPAWAWRPNAKPLERDEFGRLVKAGVMKPEDAAVRPVDAVTGKPVVLHAGSVQWNAYRKRWVMIANEVGGKASNLGEVFYLEGDAPEGPWLKAVKVITHDRYSFYNPIHHPFFDGDGGRYLYVEGTYSGTFSREHEWTPRYDYNQVMYRIDLADERLRAAVADVKP
jgi:hypothetical protein